MTAHMASVGSVTETGTSSPGVSRHQVVGPSSRSMPTRPSGTAPDPEAVDDVKLDAVAGNNDDRELRHHPRAGHAVRARVRDDHARTPLAPHLDGQHHHTALD